MAIPIPILLAFCRASQWNVFNEVDVSGGFQRQSMMLDLIRSVALETSDKVRVTELFRADCMQ